jgi:hypothetical protein
LILLLFILTFVVATCCYIRPCFITVIIVVRSFFGLTIILLFLTLRRLSMVSQVAAVSCPLSCMGIMGHVTISIHVLIERKNQKENKLVMTEDEIRPITASGSDDVSKFT